MKKLLVLSLTCLLLAACGDKDDDNTFEKKGYLTSLDEAKKGIVGVWEFTTSGGGVYYYGYDENGKTCDGYKPNKLDVGCTQYEILKQGDKYILRTYDYSSTKIYIDRVITLLNDQKHMLDNDGYELIRVK